MDHLIPDIDPRDSAKRLLTTNGQVTQVLGTGKDGIVFSTSRRSVIKVLLSTGRFDRELSVYKRLQDHSVHQVNGHNVPRLIDYDRSLLAIEITHVKPPYVIDFAESHLDGPAYTPERIQMWMDKLQDNFGSRFSDAMDVYHELIKRYGIYHYDLSLENIKFADQSPEEG